jgi:hypothetical protein
MATIYSRLNKDGTLRWRVQIRRKGMKSFSCHFFCENEARKFVKENEKKYIFGNLNFEKLIHIREQEFKRKENDHSN